jgi:hypothetical protein
VAQVHPQRPPCPVVNAIVWLVTLPYFFGSALYYGILLTKWALGEPFRPDALFAVVCATMGVMVSVMLVLAFRSVRTLQQSSADQTG